MPNLVRVKDNLTHGRGDLPDQIRRGGDLFVATDDEVQSFGDKFIILDDTQVQRAVNSMTVGCVAALADDRIKAQYLIDIERAGKKRTTLIDQLLQVGE